MEIPKGLDKFHILRPLYVHIQWTYVRFLKLIVFLV